MSSPYKKGKLYEISLDTLKSDPGQPRKILDEQALEDMTASISKVGVIQPIIFRTGIAGHDPGIAGHDPISPEIGIVSQDSVNQDSKPQLIVVAGERRVAAARKAGLTSIPAIYIAGANYAEVALVENLLRQDLTAVEEAEALQRLMTEQKYTQEQFGTIVGKARTTMGDILTLNKLPQTIRDECRGDRQISRATLIEIARKKQERGMITAYNAYKAKQQKTKGTRKKKDPNNPQALIVMFQKVVAKIQAVDTSAWDEDDQINYQSALKDFKTEIENYLATLPPMLR
jgi:ParB family chromosome partitioning protein